MKMLIIFSVLLTSLIYADLSVEQIRNMVSKIHEKREGIKLETLENTKEPFVRLQEENNITTFLVPQKADEEKLSLHAILNGKAYVNESWKKIGEGVGGYTLKYIGKKGIVLRNKNKIKKLFLHKERDDFITIEGRDN